MINLILNILWFILGGLFSALGWFFAGAVLFITLIGIPWSRACFRLGMFSLWPFGRTVEADTALRGRARSDMGAVLYVLGNIVWFVLAGWWLALAHLSLAIVNAVTIIGIPFGWQHLKLARASLFPLGARLIRVGEVKAVRRRAGNGDVGGGE